MEFNNTKIKIKQIKNKIPVKYRKKIKSALKGWRSKRNKLFHKYIGKVVSKDQISIALKKIGIKKGDTVLVHSSISRLGFVDGGAEAILEVLLDAVGPDGTIGAPTFWALTTDYLSGKTTFNVSQSKSYLGALTEKIRTHPRSKRSWHPTHSVAFIGPMADYLVGDHHLDRTPFGMNSPYRRLIEIEGKILLLGVDIEYMTSLHTIEDSIDNFSINIYESNPINFTVISEDNSTHSVVSYVHSRETAKFRNSMKILPYLNKYKIFKKTQVGFGEVKVVDAQKLHRILIKLYHNGVTMYY